jgi:hypothetical protein
VYLPGTAVEWTETFGPDGARNDGLPEMPLLVHTYDDSLTAGFSVNDDETWQYYLSRNLGQQVKNFGVTGYGTCQALLKLERHIDEGRVAPVTVLGIRYGVSRRAVRRRAVRSTLLGRQVSRSAVV